MVEIDIDSLKDLLNKQQIATTVLANKLEEIKKTVERDMDDKWQIISDLTKKVKELEEKIEKWNQK